MNIIKNIWRVDKAAVIKDEKHRNSLWRFGAIIEYNDDIWFVDLDDTKDEEAFEKFINEEDIDSAYVAENTLHEKFATEDYDPEYYKYYYKGKMTPYKPE